MDGMPMFFSVYCQMLTVLLALTGMFLTAMPGCVGMLASCSCLTEKMSGRRRPANLNAYTCKKKRMWREGWYRTDVEQRAPLDPPTKVGRDAGSR
jgi:hypothetical protein